MKLLEDRKLDLDKKEQQLIQKSETFKRDFAQKTQDLESQEKAIDTRLDELQAASQFLKSLAEPPDSDLHGSQ